MDNLMRKHASRLYNPDIANVFYLAGFIERPGRGIEKICGAPESDSLPGPEYLVKSRRHHGEIYRFVKGIGTAPASSSIHTK